MPVLFLLFDFINLVGIEESDQASYFFFFFFYVYHYFVIYFCYFFLVDKKIFFYAVILFDFDMTSLNLKISSWKPFFIIQDYSIYILFHFYDYLVVHSYYSLL